MSNDAMSWALKQPVPMSAAKFVLFIMADQATTDLAFMAVDTIAQRTALNRKTVMASIERLVAWGFIEDTGERRGKSGQIPVYRLLMKEGLFDNEYHSSKKPKNGTGTKTGTVPKTAGKSTNFGVEESQNRDTDTNDPNDPSLSARVTACAVAMIAAGFPAARMNHSHPDLLRAAAECTPTELADMVTEVLARGGAPPNIAYVCTTAVNRRKEAAAREQADAANQTERRGSGRQAGRQSLADQAAERAARIFGAGAQGTGDAVAERPD